MALVRAFTSESMVEMSLSIMEAARLLVAGRAIAAVTKRRMFLMATITMVWMRSEQLD